MAKNVTTSGNCAVCGTQCEWTDFGPDQQNTSMDLDLRPGEPARSRLETWVHRCPECGYCSLDLTDPVPPVAAEVVASEPYTRQLSDRKFPELANSFLCSAMIKDAYNNLPLAGWECLRAAWVCDDRSLGQRARECRLKALVFFEEAMREQPEYARMWFVGDLLLCDLLRRTEQFQRVQHIADIDLLRPWPEEIESILRYEVMLAGNHDAKSHTFEEALEGAPASGALKN
jgi:hypothetical protein